MASIIARKLVTKSNATWLARFLTTPPRPISPNFKDLLHGFDEISVNSEEFPKKLDNFLTVAEALLGNGIGSHGDLMLKREGSLGYQSNTKASNLIKTNASQKLSNDGLEVFLEASGFNKHNLQMLGQGNTMYIMGMAVTPLGIRLIHDEVKVDAGFLYDAHNVVAELSSGILKVKLPTGTKETMMAEPFPIKWV